MRIYLCCISTLKKKIKKITCNDNSKTKNQRKYIKIYVAMHIHFLFSNHISVTDTPKKPSVRMYQSHSQ